VIRVFINDVIVATVPAPIRADGPVPCCDIEEKAARKPEAVVVAVDSHNTITIARAGANEASVGEGMVEVVALIVRAVVAVPVIIAYVWPRINLALPARFALRFHRAFVSCRRRGWNPSLVRVRLAVRLLLSFLRMRGRLRWTLRLA